MRGLTPEERRFILSDEVNCVLGYRLERRGLLVEVRCECGGPVLGNCDCTSIVMAITPAGELALRLDAAARAIGGAR